jgi:N-acetylmuramoyl-L-alanine amidase
VNSKSYPVIDQFLERICQICIHAALKSLVSRDFGRNPCHLSEMNESRSTNFETRLQNTVLKHIRPDFPQIMTNITYRMPNCHTSANCRLARLHSAWQFLFAITVSILLSILSVADARSSQESGRSAVLLELETDGNLVSLKFDHPVNLKIVHLDNPARIVIDLPETNFSALDKGARLPELITDIRYGLMSPGLSRIVLALSMPALAVGSSETSASETHQITFSIVDQRVFSERAAADSAALNTAQTAKTDASVDVAAQQAQGAFTVIIDPGHGGIDSGAEGKLGTREKDITLAFGQAIRDALKASPDVRVIMTRDTDVFVGLHERVKIARQNNAELFLSVHGDSIKLGDVRGATIYTLSDSASDAISSALASQENLADSIAGLPPMQPDPDMNSILVDLLKQETATFSRQLATEIVVHLQENAVELINNPLRAAGFSVLTAPDVPSLLLEMGYLSNHEDELLLRDPSWRARTAAIIAKAIETYAKGHRTRTAQP